MAELNPEDSEKLKILIGLPPEDLAQRLITATNELKGVRGDLDNTRESLERATGIHRGLIEVYADRTAITTVDGENGTLHHRGYDIVDLAKNSSFEEITYLLLFGELPTQTQLDELDARLRESREIPSEITDILYAVEDGHPMIALQSAVPALDVFDRKYDRNDNSREANIHRGIQLIAKIPTIVSAHYRIFNVQEPVPPEDNLGHAANFLYMLKDEEPTDLEVKVLNGDLVVHADHCFNASTFIARGVASTTANFYHATASGIGALAGPLHGGAAEDVMTMLEEIGDIGNVESYVKEKGLRVPGFGHRVYKSIDPRATFLRKAVEEFSNELGNTKGLEMLDAIKNEMVKYERRGIFANVDFYSVIAYSLMGIPKDFFGPVFVAARASGWAAQLAEQYTNNILMRPLAQYGGPEKRPYVPMAQRQS
jgi:citrate synthase